VLRSTPNSPSFVFDQLALEWQMTRCEKFAFAALLEESKPQVAIEVGTYRGGSLQVISKYAQKVYSLDINAESQKALAPLFSNVDFKVGDSKEMLPDLVQQIQSKGENVGFILIDGEHTSNGVRRDINAVLQIKPQRPIYLVMHDSFNPECRRGMLAADWQSCPFVHFVEIDFVPGVFHFDAFDTAQAKSMWGGLALAQLLPTQRTEPLTIHQSQKGLFDTVFSHSCYAPPKPAARESIASKIKRKLLGAPT